jgi:hypothetical protein
VLQQQPDVVSMFPQERELLFDGDVFAAAEMIAVVEQ